MKRVVFQLIILMVVVFLCIGTFFFVQRILQIPFRSANDTLHKKGTALTLDFLIPAGAHIDENITIGQVVKIRMTQNTSPYEAAVRCIVRFDSPTICMAGQRYILKHQRVTPLRVQETKKMTLI